MHNVCVISNTRRMRCAIREQRLGVVKDFLVIIDNSNDQSVDDLNVSLLRCDTFGFHSLHRLWEYIKVLCSMKFYTVSALFSFLQAITIGRTFENFTAVHRRSHSSSCRLASSRSLTGMCVHGIWNMKCICKTYNSQRSTAVSPSSRRPLHVVASPHPSPSLQLEIRYVFVMCNINQIFNMQHES